MRTGTPTPRSGAEGGAFLQSLPGRMRGSETSDVSNKRPQFSTQSPKSSGAPGATAAPSGKGKPDTGSRVGNLLNSVAPLSNDIAGVATSAVQLGSAFLQVGQAIISAEAELVKGWAHTVEQASKPAG